MEPGAPTLRAGLDSPLFTGWREINRSAATGETLLIAGRPSAWIAVPGTLGWLLVFVTLVVLRNRFLRAGVALSDAALAPLVLVIVLGMAWPWFALIARRYLLTDRRVYARAGVIRRDEADVPLTQAQGVAVLRPVVQRVLGLGTIVVSSAAGSGVAWRWMPRSEQLADKIRMAIDRPVTGNPLILGLAGGIGAGKSAVAAILAGMGYLVIDSDKDAKAALDRPEVVGQLVQWWGQSILDADGRVNRAAVAKIIFADPSQRTRLEALVHPLIKADRGRLADRARADGRPGVVLDAPLLFEAGSDAECDAVIFVDAPRDLRLGRIAARGWDAAEMDRRENAQLPLEEKRRRSDVVVINDSDHATLARRVADALGKLNTPRQLSR